MVNKQKMILGSVDISDAVDISNAMMDKGKKNAKALVTEYSRR